jgi:hypothetical protein
MSDDSISLLLTWLPFFALLVVFGFYARYAGMHARGPSGSTLIELYEQLVVETKHTNSTLERIAAALEKHAGKTGG